MSMVGAREQVSDDVTIDADEAEPAARQRLVDQRFRLVCVQYAITDAGRQNIVDAHCPLIGTGFGSACTSHEDGDTRQAGCKAGNIGTRLSGRRQ